MRARVRLYWGIGTIVGLAIVWLSFVSSSNRQAHEQPLDVIAAQVLRTHVDYERRTEPLSGGQSLNDYWDLSAVRKMPEDYRTAISVYLHAVGNELEFSNPSRTRYFHRDRSASSSLISIWPDDVNPVVDRDIFCPVLILSRPEVIERWCSSRAGSAAGWRSADNALSEQVTVYGRTLFFEPGEQSGEPMIVPPSPLGATIPQADNFLPIRSSIGTFYRDWQKVVPKPKYDGTDGELQDDVRRLRISESGGAQLLGELRTAPAHFQNGRLWWVDCYDGSNTRRFLAYALVDGNGGLRTQDLHQQTALGLVSPYMRPLTCPPHQPRVLQHDLLLMPSPIVWATTAAECWAFELVNQGSYEMWCLDDWFPAQEDAVWVIRETPDSKPLLESFELLPARTKSDNPVFLIAVFAETPPSQLIREFAALQGVSASHVLDSVEKMRELESHYRAVRDASSNW